jgi:hypothetical protein
LKNDLSACIEALEQQNETLGKARNSYLSKEAERKHFESNLIKAAAGKSHAERVVNAQATSEWLAFHKDLARLQAVFEFQKLKYEILDKEWLAQYAANKMDSAVIKRHA